MMPKNQPLVSILTPVYNGEKYLRECIESVLSQTYENWEFVIVNNCSTDRSLEIIQHYAAIEPRIRLVNNHNFLPLVKNLNHTFRQISEESKYCKVVHADDWIFPDCVARMVEVAEEYPTVGIVGAYMLQGNKIVCDGLPYNRSLLSGTETCRFDLFSGPGTSIFGGSPTALLIRSDLIRQRLEFYNEAHLYADREICYELLQEVDFGFVHQVLTFARVHDKQASAFIREISGYQVARLYILKKYGLVYLSKDEYRQLLKVRLSLYYTFLGKNFFYRRNKNFWEYQKQELNKIGIPLSRFRLLWMASLELSDILLNPKKALELLFRKFKRNIEVKHPVAGKEKIPEEIHSAT